MNANTIEPSTAAKLADAVYGIQLSDSVAKGFAQRGVSGLDRLFDLSQATVAHGVSGAGRMSEESGFAVVIPGKGTLQGDYAIVARGTATGYDWLSNFNISLERGPAGYPVHAGFQKVFKTIEGTIDTALFRKNPSAVYCVGHSLGGAIANIVAAKMIQRGHDVSLYTFGAPRVGMDGMTRYLDSRLGTNGIYRVYNPADVVPLVPIHPFVHAPRNRAGLCVKTGGELFSFKAHDMSNYGLAVEHLSWRQLEAPSSSMPIHANIDQWLSRAADYATIPGSSLALWALGHALKGLIDLAHASVGLAIAIGSTAIDIIASLLFKAAALSKEIGEKLLEWIVIVLKFLGRTTIQTTRDITQSFLRWVLDLLIRPLAALAHRAIELGMR